MEPKKDENALVDFIDVLLQEGVIIKADIIITVADIPLIGINLQAAIAGMTTMTEYGVLEEWDKKKREKNKI